MITLLKGKQKHLLKSFDDMHHFLFTYAFSIS